MLFALVSLVYLYSCSAFAYSHLIVIACLWGLHTYAFVFCIHIQFIRWHAAVAVSGHPRE